MIPAVLADGHRPPVPVDLRRARGQVRADGGRGQHRLSTPRAIRCAQDAGLLGLVGQLRPRGTWEARPGRHQERRPQGFATWVYRALMPTVYDRWDITNARTTGTDDDTVSALAGRASGRGTARRHRRRTNFITLAADGLEQRAFRATVGIWGDWGCSSDKPPDDLIGRIWEPSTPTTATTARQPETAWTFSCSVGVDETTSSGSTAGGSRLVGNPGPNPNSPDAAARAMAAPPRAVAIADQARPGAARAPARGGRPGADGRPSRQPAAHAAGGCDGRGGPAAVRAGASRATAPRGVAGAADQAAGCRATAAGASRRRPAAAGRSGSGCAGAGVAARR